MSMPFSRTVRSLSSDRFRRSSASLLAAPYVSFAIFFDEYLLHFGATL